MLATEQENKYTLRIIDNSVSGTRLWTWRVQDKDRMEQSRKQVNLAHSSYLSGLMSIPITGQECVETQLTVVVTVADTDLTMTLH